MRLSAVVALAFAAACGPLVPHPPYGTQMPSALEPVDRPPPPARVEILPERPAPKAVWIDGEWIWRRGRWAWLLGRWVIAPPGAVFAPGVFVRGADGRLWYAPGVWRDQNGEPLADGPTALSLASVQGGAVVNADGEVETTGPVLRELRKEVKPAEGADGGAP
jgi:hypothetical protein